MELKKKGIVIEDFYNKPLAKHIFTALQQEKYQAIHLRNLEYLKEIATHGLIPEANTYGLSKLVHFYAATNEIIGIKLLVDNGACNRSAICDEAYDIAVQNDNRKIMKILKERTSLL